MGDLKYKVGDKVRIKSFDWYKENKDEDGNVSCGEFDFVEGMKKFCSETLLISEDAGDGYLMLEDYHGYVWTDEMIEGLVQDENNHLTETVVDTVRESNDRYRIVIDTRFDIEVDEGEYYAVRRKKEYPKTFLGCCDVLGIEDTISRGVKGYKSNLLDTFQKLLICRDAYWKIAGEEMGLEKPWEPDYTNTDKRKFSIWVDFGKIKLGTFTTTQMVLSFPTEEMRDAFFNAFRDDIEKCKELL